MEYNYGDMGIWAKLWGYGYLGGRREISDNSAHRIEKGGRR